MSIKENFVVNVINFLHIHYNLLLLCFVKQPKPRFTQKVTWSFEDIRMLLGSNLPIFGNDSQPAVSIRLCDMNKPITVLTGLDYWLDNLMCNVPQVAMCYHLNGIVQVPYCSGSDHWCFINRRQSMCLCTHAF